MQEQTSICAPEILALKTTLRFLAINRRERPSNTPGTSNASPASSRRSRSSTPVPRDIEAWRDALLTEGKNQPQSVRRKLAAVSSFFKWRKKKKLREGDNPFDSVEMPDVGKRLPKHVSDADVRKLLGVRLKHRRCSAFQVARDRAMLEVLYGSGLRRAEWCGLDIDDVDLESATVRVRHGKGDKERFSFLSEPAVDALREYLALRPADSKDASLFVTIRKSRITTRQLWCVFRDHREAAKALGLNKHLVPHGLRHAFATGLYEGGADIRAIQELLGHSNIQTTTIYTHVGIDRKRAVYEAAHPRARAVPGRNLGRMSTDFEARLERERLTIQAFMQYFKRRYPKATLDLLPRAGTMTRILIRLPGTPPGSELRTLDFGITDTRMATITARGILTVDLVEPYLRSEHEFFETLESGSPAILYA